MLSYLSIFTVTVILVQTTSYIIISWLTLSCKFAPNVSEPHELTLTKLLYLYDPEACGRVFFYNHTAVVKGRLTLTTVVWPVKNNIASGFRKKMHVWLSLHVIWTLFCIAYMTQGQRPCGFYATLVPFSITGLVLLLVDILHMSLFILDTSKTNTETNILKYVDSNQNHLRWLNKTRQPFTKQNAISDIPEDTSWISLLFAYASCRGVVQWFINFWIVKDNFFEGLKFNKRFQAEKLSKVRYRSPQNLPA